MLGRLFHFFGASQPVQDDRVRMIDAATLRAWLDAGSAVVVDVREPKEFVEEHIPGAKLVPLSTFDADKVPALDGRKLVLQCRSGIRCGMAAQRLLQAGHEGPIHRLQGGLAAWKAEGGPVVAGF